MAAAQLATGSWAPTVSVVVPARDNVEQLRRCLALLRAQDYPPSRYEVIVVDNDSTDDVRSAVPADSRFQVVREGRRGSYAARNSGTVSATGAVLAFTDSDCLPRPDWLRAGVAVLCSQPLPDAVGGAIEMSFRNGSCPETGPEHYDALDGLPQQEHFIQTYPFAATANMLVWTATFEAVGPFEADLVSGGDREWGARLAAIGGTFAYAPAAIVDHPTRATWTELTRKSRRIGQGLASLEDTDQARTVLVGIIGEVVSALLLYKKVWTLGQPSSRAHKLATAAAFCWARGIRIAIRSRRLAQRGKLHPWR